MTQVKLSNGNLVITVPVNKDPQPSKSTGKVLIVAGTYGKSGVEFQGKPLTVNVNAYIPADK
jgi:hypothetical protein